MHTRTILKAIYGLALSLGLFLPACVPVVHAAPADQPDIRTYSTATSSVTTIIAPAGYESRVISTYDGSAFRTFATSTPLTAEDAKALQDSVQQEMAAARKLFDQQEALFAEQEKMFRDIWGSLDM